MASWYLGINRGQNSANFGLVVISSASQSTDFEVRIDTGKNSTKEDAWNALEQIKNYIISNGIQSGEAGSDLPPD